MRGKLVYKEEKLAYKDGFKVGLKKLREARHLTQAELADRIGFSKSTVANWEQGRNTPEDETVEKLCKFFDCSADQLFGQIDCANHDLQFIQDFSGLTEPAILALQKIKNDSIKTFVLSYLLEDGRLLDKLTSYYVSSFEAVAKGKRPYSLVPYEKPKMHKKYFYADVLETLPVDCAHFFEMHKNKPENEKLAVYGLIDRVCYEQQREAWYQRVYNYEKNPSQSGWPEQDRALAEYLLYTGCDDFMNRAGCDLKEIYRTAITDENDL